MKSEHPSSRRPEQRLVDPSPPAGGRAGKRPYSQPRLTSLGELTDVTLGGSPGLLDSANPTIQEP